LEADPAAKLHISDVIFIQIKEIAVRFQQWWAVPPSLLSTRDAFPLLPNFELWLRHSSAQVISLGFVTTIVFEPVVDRVYFY